MKVERDELRVLLRTPTPRDGELARTFLGRAGIDAVLCPSDGALQSEIRLGAGVLMLGEELVNGPMLVELRGAIDEEGPWSDLPVIVFSRAGAGSDELLQTLAPLGNVTILERPIRLSTLISAVGTALRARRRQYEVRDLLRRQLEADRRKDEFLAMLGHELRNPLAAIRNALFVLEETGDERPAAVRQREVIGRQVAHLVRMVDDLLDVSRVTLGKVTLQRSAVDLQEVAERCARELGLAAQARESGLEFRLEAEPALVDGDPVRLEQVLCNLIQNAIKYTPAGGRVEVRVQRENGEAVVRVRDTGVGIPPAMLGQIFELFTQVQSSQKRSQGGLGLGLPLVRSLIALHGGTIVARSAGSGLGSEFEVRLPLRRGAAESAPAPALVRGPERLAVLVVEDNADGRESLRTLLELWGHTVEVAEDGPQGLARALTMRPDVLLVDIGLPGFDGNELVRRLLARVPRDGMRLVAMTGFGQPEDRTRAEQAGFDRYLVKPVDLGELTRLLGEAAENRSRRHGDPGGGTVEETPRSGRIGGDDDEAPREAASA